MSTFPRIALGATCPSFDLRAITWALLDVLQRHGVQVQKFRSQASFCPWDASATITGQGSRHLDSWTMDLAECRRAFCRGARSSDLALIDGCFSAAPPDHAAAAIGSRLDTICGWLNVPRVVVVDAHDIEACRLPERPSADAILLSGVASSRDYFYWQTALQALWSIPVIGGMQTRPVLREAVRHLPPGAPPSRELCRQLGDALLPHFNYKALRHLAQSAEFPIDSSDIDDHVAPTPASTPTSTPTSTSTPTPNVTVAMAYDDAFCGYFPDTLDLLEDLGVRLMDFSPLRDGQLPAGTDIVYFGCGKPEQFAHELSGNECLVHALRNHLCAGKRIYAEACSLAYLCQHLETPETGRVPMVGILPAVARRNPVMQPPRPLEVTLARHTWLGNAGMHLRGYLNTTWNLEFVGRVQPLCAEPGHEHDLVSRHQAVGSRMHLNFASQPDFLRNFSRPHPAALAWSGLT